MNKLLSRFAADESGAGAVEYSLVLLVAVAIVTLVNTSLKTQISTLLVTIGTRLTAGVAAIS